MSILQLWVLVCYLHATDLDGNTATATRTVNVVDTTAPVVTVTGQSSTG